jgi:hypothetical protein
MFRAAALALALAVCATRAAAQRRDAPLPPAVTPWVASDSGMSPDSVPPATPLLRRPWVRPLASLLIPGTGQLLARQEHGLLYLATEIWVAARAVALERRGRRERALYRDLAFNVARRRFTATRVDGPFTYYETMERFVESGVYDADPGAPFVPESDTTTFNGSVWLLARRTFFADPDSLAPPTSVEYQNAIAFYRERAVTDAFRWSWRDARLEQDVFRAAIRASDEAFRSATNYFGGLVINHLASAVDALIANRLAGRRVRVPKVGVVDGPRELVLTWHLVF